MPGGRDYTRIVKLFCEDGVLVGTVPPHIAEVDRRFDRAVMCDRFAEAAE